MRNLPLPLAVFCGALLTAGCTPNFPRTVPVHGKVTLEGEPVRGAEIQFIAAGLPTATGKIGPDGEYRLGSFQFEDGAVPGTYRVVVKPVEISTPYGPAPMFSIPERYQSPDTSGLEARVGPGTTELNFNLKLGDR